MADITAAMVKDLREKSGAGMMDCKKALNEAGGDMDAALDWLRTKGLAAAQKKSSRTAAEGLVGVAVAGTKGAVVEVNSETDFVAKNEQFQGFVRDVTQIALATGDAFDVKVRAVVESRTRINASRWQTKMRYTLTNATPAAVSVELAQAGLDWTDTRITEQSRPSERSDAGQAVWQVPVPANGSATVTATFDTRF